MEALIPNLRTATSSYRSGYSNPLLDTSNRSWRPQTNAASEYLELRLPSGEAYYVTSVETRGGVTSDYFVTSYTLKVYDDEAQNWVGNDVNARSRSLSGQSPLF